MRIIESDIYIGGQIECADMATLARAGVCGIINNRPDGEEQGQPQSASLEEAARAAGLDYAAIPIAMGLTAEAVAASRKALAQRAGPLLLFCKSGMRSAALWASVRAGEGHDVDELIAAARDAGVELGGFRGMLLGSARLASADQRGKPAS